MTTRLIVVAASGFVAGAVVYYAVAIGLIVLVNLPGPWHSLEPLFEIVLFWPSVVLEPVLQRFASNDTDIGIMAIIMNGVVWGLAVGGITGIWTIRRDRKRS